MWEWHLFSIVDWQLTCMLFTNKATSDTTQLVKKRCCYLLSNFILYFCWFPFVQQNISFINLSFSTWIMNYSNIKAQKKINQENPRKQRNQIKWVSILLLFPLFSHCVRNCKAYKQSLYEKFASTFFEKLKITVYTYFNKKIRNSLC